MRSKGVAMENSLETMFNIPLLNTFQKLVIIGSSLTELHQFIQMTLLWTFMSASTNIHLWLTNPWRTNSRSKNPRPTIQFRSAWYTCTYVRRIIHTYIRTYDIRTYDIRTKILKYRRKRNACDITAEKY